MIKGRTILLLVFLLTGRPGLMGQSLADYQDQIYQSYISGDMRSWESALEGLQGLYHREPSGSVLYNLLLAHYGLAGYYLGTDEKHKARALLPQAEALLEQLQDYPGYRSQQLAFRGAFLGFRISLSPLRAMVLGPRSMQAIDRALEADPTNPTAQLEKANALYYAPALVGGSKSQAIIHYHTALELMEQQSYRGHRWLHLSTLVALATAYESTGDIAQAIFTLEQALEREPQFRWVKEELLPHLRKNNP